MAKPAWRGGSEAAASGVVVHRVAGAFLHAHYFPQLHCQCAAELL